MCLNVVKRVFVDIFVVVVVDVKKGDCFAVMRNVVPLAVLASGMGEDKRKQELTHAGCVKNKKGSRPDKRAVIDRRE